MEKIGRKQLVLGEVILDRLRSVRGSKRLRNARDGFQQLHDAYVSKSDELTRLKADINAARDAVHGADKQLDETVRQLADRLIGAQMGPRANPFAPFSPHRASEITRLAYATELRMVRSLLNRVERAEPPKEVRQVVVRCRERADAVDRALRAISVPRARCEKVTSDLGSLAKQWRDAFQRLKIEAAAYWVDDRATREAIFARPEPIQRPVKRKRGRKTAVAALPVATRA